MIYSSRTFDFDLKKEFEECWNSFSEEKRKKICEMMLKAFNDVIAGEDCGISFMASMLILAESERQMERGAYFDEFDE